MHRLISLFGILIASSAGAAADYDVVVYGGTASGAVAAVQAARMGKSVVLIEPGRHIGGLTSGGLGWTDSGDKAVVGGIAREFYQRVKKHYDDPAAWTRQRRDEYPFYRAKDDAMWAFEPKVAEKILRDTLAEAKVPVVFGERLDRAKGAKLDGKQIVSITMESGRTFAGRMFIDATYEGDLLAAAGVTYTVGREPNRQYGETVNGVARKWNTHMHRSENRSLCEARRHDERLAIRHRGGDAARRWGSGQAHPGILLPDVHDRCAGQPCPLREARRLRRDEIRTSLPQLRGGRPAHPVEARPHAQREDRHQQ
jgi:hypothetical protein